MMIGPCQQDDFEFVSQAIDAHGLETSDREANMLMTTPEQMPYFQDQHMLEGGTGGAMADVNQFSSKQLERAAISNERIRLARELHDGVLEALTGATLQLEALSLLIDEKSPAARKRLRDIEELIAEDQRKLRSWIRKLKPTSRQSMVPSTDLATTRSEDDDPARSG